MGVEIRVLAAAGIMLALSACGGGGGGPAGGNGPELSPEVSPVTGACTSVELDNESPPELGTGCFTASIEDEEAAIFRVPSGAEIILTTFEGNADLYLYDNLTDAGSSNYQCRSTYPTKEDNCRATASDGELYAAVYGREASSFNITSTTACSVGDVNQWIARSMNDYYYYYDKLPQLDPFAYDDTYDFVRAMRFQEQDPFSFTLDTSVYEQQASGNYNDFGVTLRYGPLGNLHVASVYRNAAFAQAGVKRGDIMESVNGVAIADADDDQLDAIYDLVLGSSDEPRTVSFVIVDGETAESRTLELTNSEYVIDTVLFVESYPVQDYDGEIGYIVFDQFNGTRSPAELDTAIQLLSDRGVKELVLDLRYNRGGRVDVAEQLANQLGQAAAGGAEMYRYSFNDKYSDRNEDYITNFSDESPSLNLNRIVVLTSGSTASASELVINTLKPYIDVVTMGSRTAGKPFVQWTRSFCEVSLNAIEAENVNANGVSVLGGIAADCYARDDVTNDYGAKEGMFNAGVSYLVDGACQASPQTKKASDKNKALVSREFSQSIGN